MRRRDFMRTGLLGAGAVALGPAFWEEALAAAPATPGPGPYGPLLAPDANGIMLPAGFRSRIVARGQVPVENTTYPWHIFSDGQATFPTADGGYILTANSEAPATAGGGASAIRFDKDARIQDAYRILANTSSNCSGGGTPWGTWLSCEEMDAGRVWECDPTGKKAAIVRPAMGVFSHEAAAVDPGGRRVYLTEDNGDGGFYRFTPTAYPDLSAGLLEIAVAGPAGETTNGGKVTWVAVPDPSAATMPTRKQVGATKFRRGEGIWFDSGTVYVATTSDDRIYGYDTTGESIELVYDGDAIAAAGGQTPLSDVDNITVSRQSGDLFVCEDSGNPDPFDIAIITPDREVARFLKLTGPQHGTGQAISETTGVIFDPSGTRMYFSSQRGFGVGVVYEITGPFRLERAGGPTKGPPPLALLAGLRAPGSIATSAFRRRGLPVTVELSKMARISLTLKAGGVTLARATRDGEQGGERFTLEPTAAGRRYLSGRRRVPARLVATATADGQTSSDERQVVLRGASGGGPGSGRGPNGRPNGSRNQRVSQGGRRNRRRQRFSGR